MGGVSVMLLSLIPFRFLVHYQFVNSLTVYKEIRKVKYLLVWEIMLYTGLAFLLGSQFGLIGLLSANLLSMCGGALFSGMKWFSVYSCISFQGLIRLFFRMVAPLMLAFILIYLLATQMLNFDFGNSVMLTAIWGILFTVVGYFIVMDSDDRHQIALLSGTLRKKI